jgi:catechol 2,3-dioxygenase-like lactoylglutathione lyase family enzyme
MRSWLIVASAALACVLAQPAFAQLAPPNATGITYGHVHLNSADPEVLEKLWVDQFGAVLSTKGTLTVAKLPGMLIAFRKAEPTGTNEGTAMDHFGLKVRDLAAALQKWRAAGYEVQREFKGSEGFPNAFLLGPDHLRFELQEDKTLSVPVAAYHLHFRVPNTAELRDWYADTFSLEKGKSGAFETAEAPGVRLMFQNAPAPPAAGTKGRSVDHIGFEIKNLEAFCKKLEARGVKFDMPYRQVPAIGLNIAYITDPSGVYIELTEGYDKY